MQKCNMKPSAKCRVKRWLAVCCRAVIAMKWIHEYSSGRCEEMSKMSCGFCTRRVTSQRVRMGVALHFSGLRLQSVARATCTLYADLTWSPFYFSKLDGHVPFSSRLRQTSFRMRRQPSALTIDLTPPSPPPPPPPFHRVFVGQALSLMVGPAPVTVNVARKANWSN